MRDRLVGAERILLARGDGENELVAPAHAPESLTDLGVLAKFVLDAATQLGVPAVDVVWLLERLFTLLSSCDERRVEQWDLESWWSYVQADTRSEAFRRYLADGLTRTLVAARAKEMSARTGGLILVQLLLDLSRAGDRADRVLSAPTSDVWIDAVDRASALARRGRAAGGGRRGDHRARRADRRRDRRRARRRGRHVRRRAAGGDHAHAALARAARRRAAAERARPAGHALDERDHVLPARGPPAGARPRDLPRLRVGADVDLAASVLARLRLSGDRRRAVARHLRVAAPGAADGQGRGARARPRRSAPRSGANCRTTSRTRWTGSRSSPGSWTRRSSSRTPRARPTPSRCW